jgi:hypothetical protein
MKGLERRLGERSGKRRHGVVRVHTDGGGGGDATHPGKIHMTL